jgi:hypothetical protein
MTVKLSILHELPLPADWQLDVLYLQYLWESDEDTILETEFYEPFPKPDDEVMGIS